MFIFVVRRIVVAVRVVVFPDLYLDEWGLEHCFGFVAVLGWVDLLESVGSAGVGVDHQVKCACVADFLLAQTRYVVDFDFVVAVTEVVDSVVVVLGSVVGGYVAVVIEFVGMVDVVDLIDVVAGVGVVFVLTLKSCKFKFLMYQLQFSLFYMTLMQLFEIYWISMIIVILIMIIVFSILFN